MLGNRTCSAVLDTGRQCGATPQRETDYCFWHDPEQVEAAAEARRLGGQRRRREGIITSAFDFEGLADVTSIRRLLEVAVVDTLQLENSVARNRTLAALAQSASKLVEAGELAARVSALESLLADRQPGGR